ncbi:MAG: adenylate kinase [Anaerolineales bacterium]|nr:adenylate kinase [Anaerolineales bacterium]
MPVYIVILGPPGAGKGTQSRKLAKKLKLAHISSGDLFRENLKNGTKLGKLADEYIRKGELVPDDVTIGMVSDRLSQKDTVNGAIFDGFPRTPAQAEALGKMLAEFGGEVNMAAYIRVPDEELIERLAGRLTCRENGHIFHRKYNPPKETGRCDYDGSDLYQREDDQAETVKRRIDVYHEQTRPLKEYYQKLGLLFEVNGEQSIEDVMVDLLEYLSVEK